MVLLELANEGLLVHPGDARHREDAQVVVAAEPAPEAIAGAVGRRRQGVGLRDAADLAIGQRDLLDLVGAQELEELRHRDLDGPRRQEPGLQQGQDNRRHEHVGERELEALREPRFHRGSLGWMLASGPSRVKRGWVVFP